MASPTSPTTAPPWYERAHVVAPMAVVAIVVSLALAATDSPASPNGTMRGAASLPATTDHPAVDDVRLVGCSPDAAGHWTPHVAVTNHSGDASTYVLAFALETRDGTRRGDAAVVVDRVEPGRTVEQVGTSSVRGHDLTCRGTSVIRVAA